MKRGRVNPYSKDRRRKRRRRFTELSDFARDQGCQISEFAPGPCWGELQACHARAGGRGDWVILHDGTIVGNVVGGCYGHHRWQEDNPADSRADMRRTARENGELAIEAGAVEPPAPGDASHA